MKARAQRLNRSMRPRQKDGADDEAKPLPNRQVAERSMDEQSASMMQKAIRSGMIGKQQHEVSGALGVTIDSTGAPGASVRASGSDIFKQIDLKRGRSMAMADDGG